MYVPARAHTHTHTHTRERTRNSLKPHSGAKIKAKERNMDSLPFKIH